MASESVPELVEQAKSRTRGDDGPLAELARRQHGVVSRAQLLARGWTKEEIAWRIRMGRLHRLHAGVYAVGHRLVPSRGWWMAAVLASGSGAVLSHRSAAALWGLRSNPGGAVHVTVPARSTSSKRIRRHLSRVAPDEQAVEAGIPVTSVHRTIFDLAAAADLAAVIAMIREAEYRNRHDRLSLWQLLERHPGRRGSRKLRFALERLKAEPAGRKLSPLEERFAPFLRRHGLPLPRFNDWILLAGRRFRVDCHWPALRHVVELDGWEGHRTRSAFREDRARDRPVQAAGYSVTRLTWNQLDDEPAAIAVDLRALLLG